MSKLWTGSVRAVWALIATAAVTGTSAAQVQVDERGALAKQRQSAAPGQLNVHTWWWD